MKESSNTRPSDPRLRESFVERVFAYWRLRGLFSGRWTLNALIRFHTAHKLILMAHSPDASRQLGRVVAAARSMPRNDVERCYTNTFMSALAVVATPGRQANVLQHMVGYFKERLNGDSKAELLTAVEDYRRELVPLVVPMTLLRHHVHVHDVKYLTGQRYLQSPPYELMLHNHVCDK